MEELQPAKRPVDILFVDDRIDPEVLRMRRQQRLFMEQVKQNPSLDPSNIMLFTTEIGEGQANGRDQTNNVDILHLLDEAPPTVKISPKVWKSFVDYIENYYRNKGQEQVVYDGMICDFPVEDNNTDTGSDAGAEQSEFDCKPFNFSGEVQNNHSAPVINETGTALDALRESFRNNKGNFFRSPVRVRDYSLTIRDADERVESDIGSHKKIHIKDHLFFMLFDKN